MMLAAVALVCFLAGVWVGLVISAFIRFLERGYVE
jgi:hypothetical protein